MGFVVEIVIYETSECAIVHFFIPDLVTAEVRSASFAMQQAVQKVCTATADVSNVILDAPRYLFVSTNVAKRFPNLLESVIVQSYHTHSPGEIGKKWKFVNSQPRAGSRIRNFLATSLILTAFQHLGATSPTLQRVFIHSIQPLFVSLLILIWMFSMENPYFGAAMAVLVLLVLIMFAQRYLSSRNALANIAPLPDKSNDMKAKQSIQMKGFVGVVPEPDTGSKWVHDDPVLRKTDSIRDTSPVYDDDLSTGERSRVNTVDMEGDLWASVAQDGFVDVSSEDSEVDFSGDESV